MSYFISLYAKVNTANPQGRIVYASIRFEADHQMKNLALTLIGLCTFSTCLGQQIDAPFGRTNEVTRLTLILSDSGLPGGPNLTEAKLSEVGCTFHVSDPTHISEVLRILDPGVYGTSTAPVRLRHAVYLSMRDDQLGAKYLLAENQGTRGTIGSIEGASLDRPIYFYPRRDVPDQLRSWARAHIAQLSFVPPQSDPSNPCTFLP